MAGQGRHQVTGSATSDLRTAITTAGLAVGLVDLSDCTIASISEPWLSHLGRTADSVIGQPAVDLIRDDKDAATQVLTSMRDGAITAYVARREFDAPPGVEPMGTVWVRSFHIGERHYAFVQAAPGSEDSVSPVARQLGRDPIKMAIGTINPDFTITAMSRDITGVLGVAPEDLVGKVLLNVVARRDVAALLAASDGLAHQAVALRIHLQNQDDQWVQVCCILTSLAGNPDCCFILVPDADEDPSGSRVTELEHHLWTIAAIVEASGVLQGVGPMRDMTAVPQANNLTTRQWEILARLVRGERVPAIAAELYLSQSTVRNHLSAIFKRFGVHSQSELLKVLNTQQDADALTHRRAGPGRQKRLGRRTKCLAAFAEAAANLVAVVNESPEEVIADRLVTPVAVIGADSTLEYINPAGAFALGQERPWLLGRRMLDLVHPDDRRPSRPRAPQGRRRPAVERHHPVPPSRQPGT